MTVFQELNEDSSIGDILFARFERYEPLLHLADNIMRADGPIPVRERELIAAYVSALNACSFCHGVHEVVARKFGVPVDLLGDLLSGKGSAPFDAKQTALLDFARKLTLEPSKVTDQDRTAVLDAGHSQAALKDVIAIISLFSFFNRLVDGHGVEGSQEIFDRDAGMLHAGGYVPPLK